MGFSRQEYWSGLQCPSPGDLPNSGIKPTSVMSPALAGGFFTIGATWEALASCLLNDCILKVTYLKHGNFFQLYWGITGKAKLYVCIYFGENTGFIILANFREILSFATTWMNWEDNMLSEINQTQKDKHCVIPLIWGSWKKSQPHILNKLPQDFPAPWLTSLTSLPWSQVMVCFTPSQLLCHILNHLQSHIASIPLPDHNPSLLRWLWQVPSALSRPSGLWFYHCLSCFFSP